MSYLADLTLRLAAGASRLPEPLRTRHGAYLARQQQPDGGFAGRRGASDLYYTGFGLRGLALLGTLESPQAEAVARYLRAQLGRPLPPIDFLSLVFSAVILDVLGGIDVFAAAGLDRAAEVARLLAPYHRPDGGYAKSERSGQTSTYHTFLTATCLDLLRIPLVEPDPIVKLLRDRRRGDGGFVELPVMTHSGTNPTAAAIGLLKMLGALDDSLRQDAASFLARMQSPDGGLRAHDRIPLSDLLSTFTGLVALADLDRLGTIDLPAAAGWIERLQQPAGGFHGGDWDDTTDVEYTFYGLAALAVAEGMRNEG